MNKTDTPVIAIMAGGQSRRMGRDKAALELGGETLLDRVIDEAKKVSDTVAVVGRVGEREDVRWLEDEEPGLGPLGGLKTALAHLQQPVLLVACDMPLVDAEALGWLIDHFRQSTDAHGLATTRDGQIEPLFAVYLPAVLSLVEEKLSAGRLSVRRLIEDGRFEKIEATDEIADKLVNVNTPAEFDELP